MEDERIERFIARYNTVAQVIVQDGSELVCTVPVTGRESMREVVQVLEDAANLAGRKTVFTLTATAANSAVLGQFRVVVNPNEDNAPERIPQSEFVSKLVAHVEDLTRKVIDISDKLVGQSVSLLNAQRQLTEIYQGQVTQLAAAKAASDALAVEASKVATDAVATAEEAIARSEKNTSDKLQAGLQLIAKRVIEDKLGPQLEHLKAWLEANGPGVVPGTGTPGNGAS